MSINKVKPKKNRNPVMKTTKHTLEMFTDIFFCVCIYKVRHQTTPHMYIYRQCQRVEIIIITIIVMFYFHKTAKYLFLLENFLNSFKCGYTKVIK